MALSVRGLTALEDAAAGDVDPTLPEEVRRSEVARRLIASWLLAGGRPAFASAEEVAELTEPEVFGLWRAARAASDIVSPQYRTAHRDAWHDALTAGAKHRTNIALTNTIGFSTDLVVGLGGAVCVSAPDRYFGVPYAELTDGQLMAYEAAKKVLDKA